MTVTTIATFAAARVKAHLDDAGIKQADFAADIGISQQALSNYLRGSRDPTGVLVVNMSKRLRRPLEWFFGRVEVDLD